MEIVLICILAMSLGCISGMALTKNQPHATTWILWGVVICFMFSWSVPTFIGYAVQAVTDDIAFPVFWLIGIPVVLLIGIVIMLIGLLKSRQKNSRLE